MANEFSRVISKTHLLRFVHFFFFFSFSSFSLSFNFVLSLLSFVLLQLNQQFFAMILFLLRPEKNFNSRSESLGELLRTRRQQLRGTPPLCPLELMSDEGVGEDSEGEELDS